MKPPYLITPPVQSIIEAPAMRDHLRVTGEDEDVLIAEYVRAATAYLDGWKGVLGRCVMQQTWGEKFDGFGDLRLALPDVLSATVSAVDSNGAAVSVTKQVLKQDFRGFYVETDGGSAETVTVQYSVAMPIQQLPTVQMIVKLLVGNWYENRAATSETSLSEVPMAAQMLIDSIRWAPQ